LRSPHPDFARRSSVSERRRASLSKSLLRSKIGSAGFVGAGPENLVHLARISRSHFVLTCRFVGQLCPMHFVYIIDSATTRKWYIGSTMDLIGRLNNHNQGLNRSTNRRGPWSYIFVRPFESQKEAQQFERYLKSIRNKKHILKKFSIYFRFGVYPDKVGAG